MSKGGMDAKYINQRALVIQINSFVKKKPCFVYL